MSQSFFVFETRDGWAVATSLESVPAKPDIDRPGSCHRPACACRLPHPEPWWVKEKPIRGPFASQKLAEESAERIADSVDFWGA